MNVKKGDKVKLKGGQTLIVKGCYMSTTGIMVTARPEGYPGPTDMNIPIGEIAEVVSESK